MKKLGFFLFFTLISLSMLGLGFAAWNQNLNISGTVIPGMLNVSIDLEEPGLVSSAAYATISEGTSTNTSLVVNIDNAAAGNIFTVHYLVVNNSSMPVNINFNQPSISAIGTGATSADISVNTPSTPSLVEDGGSISGELTITVKDSTPMTGGVSYSVSVSISASPP